MENTIEQKIVKVGDTEYTLQQVPASWYLDAMDSCKDTNGNLQTAKYMKKIIENVVIKPKVDIDTFTGRVRELRNLNSACEKFILGDELDEEVKNDKAPEQNEKNATDKK